MVHATVPRGAAKERVRKRDEEQERRNREEAARRREERVAAGQISGDPISRARRERFQIQGPGEIREGGEVFTRGKPVTEREFRIQRDVVRPEPTVAPELEAKLDRELG